MWKKKKNQADPNGQQQQKHGQQQEDLRQDLSQEAKYSGVYMIRLLFREKVRMPDSSSILEALKARLGRVEVLPGESETASFSLLDHQVVYADEQAVPSLLMMFEPAPVEAPLADPVARTQFWDCENGAELLDSCSWQVLISDFMAGGLEPLERADILANWLEVALEMFPDCEAVYVDASGKLLDAHTARRNPYEGTMRFVYWGIHARFFTIQGTEDDMVVDTLGLYALGLPDVQYHFRGLEPNEVVRHAYNTAIYQFLHLAPIESGHTIDGLSPDAKWFCRYESSLIQPVRDVLDIAAGEHAAGQRESS